MKLDLTENQKPVFAEKMNELCRLRLRAWSLQSDLEKLVGYEIDGFDGLIDDYAISMNGEDDAMFTAENVDEAVSGLDAFELEPDTHVCACQPVEED